MRKIFLLASLLLFFIKLGYTQGIPQSVNYQAIARDAKGKEIINQKVAVRLSIFAQSPTGILEWQETHDATTSPYGVYTLQIGKGKSTTAGNKKNFSEIDWLRIPQYLKVETDNTGGSNFEQVGTIQFLSVPYALATLNAKHAINADSAMFAWKSDSANYAKEAGHAKYTDSALFANKSQYADTAKYALLALGAKGEKGDKGDAGTQGIQGPKGDPGTNGTNGSQGIQGLKGDKGDKGDAGTQGIQGFKGDKGDAGAQGIQGLKGDKGDKGDAGIQGLKGDKGDIGLQGPQGIKGDAGTNGTNGSQGIQGIKGDRGDAGFLNSGSNAGDTPFWDGNQWITDNSNIFNNGGNVGIGDFNPRFKLDVNGDASFNGVRVGRGRGNDESNLVVGSNALVNFQNGQFTTSCGRNALTTLKVGSFNTAVGYGSSQYLDEGEGNTSVGSSSMSLLTKGRANVAIGSSAMTVQTEGNTNVAIGFAALNSQMRGDNNIAIGFNAQVPNTNGSNQIRIGDIAITYAGIQVPWSPTSDRRLKSNIQPSNLGLAFIQKLKPVSYYRKNDLNKKTEYGLIAQELEEELENAGVKNTGIINKDDQGIYSVRYNDLLAPMIKAMQEQQTQIEELKKLVQTQSLQIEKLVKK